MRSVITVTGADGVGIIAKVSGLLAQHGINIVDISQTTADRRFLMVMLVEMDNADESFAQISSLLSELGESIGQSITMRHEKVFNSMHRI